MRAMKALVALGGVVGRMQRMRTLGFSLVALTLGAPLFAQIPLQAWVHDPVIGGVSISPDGKHIAAISLPDINSVPQVTVWSADNLDQPPLRFDLGDKDGGRWKPQSVSWLNN